MRVFLLLLALSCVHPASGHAQDATHAAAARALFSEGVALADAQDWASAADRFQRARELRSSPTISLNLAVALGHLGRVVEAAELCRGVLHDVAATSELRALATENLSELEPRIATVRLLVEGALEGATLVADGRALSATLVGGDVPLDPGSHHIAIFRDGAEVAGHDVTLLDGERGELRLVVPPRPIEAVVAEPVIEEPVEEPLIEAPELLHSSGPDPVVVGLATAGGVVLLGGALTFILVFALPSEASPYVGNVGVLEIGR